MEEELSTADHGQGVFEFEGWRLEAAEHRLIGADGNPVQLPARPFQLLHYMVARAGRLLTRQALLDAVWRNVVVEENSLNQAISTLRRLLGDASGQRRFIETVPGVGYRFIAPVHVLTTEPSLKPITVAPAAPRARPRHVARWPLAALVLAAAVAAAFATLQTHDSPQPVQGHRHGWDTEDPVARELYVRAGGLQARGGPDNFTRAAELLQQAVDTDPDFGHAWAQLGKARLQMVIATAPDPADNLRLSVEALHRALDLAPDTVEVLRLQQQSAMLRHDWRLAASSATRLDALQPPARAECSEAANFEFYALGRGMARAAICARDWLNEQPLSLLTSAAAQTAFHAAGRDDLADEEYVRSQDLAGDRRAVEVMALARMWGHAGRDALRAQLERLDEAMPSQFYGRLLEVFEDRDSSLRFLRDTYDSDPSGRALMAGWLDRYGDAPRAADAAYRLFMEQYHNLYADLWQYSPATRRQPRFRQLLVDLSLIDYFRETGVWNDYCQPVGEDDFDCSLSGPAQEQVTLTRIQRSVTSRPAPATTVHAR
jgi:DNA-binding winged helix-turn-helix (wHTH) protein